jgi:hypothetical protein
MSIEFKPGELIHMREPPSGSWTSQGRRVVLRESRSWDPETAMWNWVEVCIDSPALVIGMIGSGEVIVLMEGRILIGSRASDWELLPGCLPCVQE